MEHSNKVLKPIQERFCRFCGSFNIVEEEVTEEFCSLRCEMPNCGKLTTI